jgi:hypothetical protein
MMEAEEIPEAFFFILRLTLLISRENVTRSFITYALRLLVPWVRGVEGTEIIL